ncbi:MAG: ATP-binding protein [Candidatus Micrarchaeia archaeon]
MVEVFEARVKLLQELGWSENPFVKDLRASDRDSFLKYYCPFEGAKILERLAFESKACLLFGPKGVGKTSALYYVSYGLPESEFDCVFLKEPPKSLDDLAEAFNCKPSENWISRLLGGKPAKVTRKGLADCLKRRSKKIVLFVDEAHLVEDKSMYMEFKYLLDDVPRLRMVFSALGKADFPDSLLQLVGESNCFQRREFSEQEMRRIIEHRIAAVGGKGLKPFPDAFLSDALKGQNLLSPRYVFDELNAFLAKLALGKSEWKGAVEYADNPIIQSAIRGARGETLAKGNAAWWNQLSPSQRQILELLVRKGEGVVLSDIRKETGLSQNTAFNALYQLRGDDKAELKRKPGVPFPLVRVEAQMVGGRKRNVYVAVEKVRNLFTLH